MDTKNKKIILASASPRRKELLGGLGVDFEVDTRNNFVVENYEAYQNRAENGAGFMSFFKSFFGKRM